MVKKRLLRKGVAYLLSAAMVLTSNGLIPGVVQTASAAVADDVASALLKKYDMMSNAGITVAGTNSAGVTIQNGVLTVPGNGAAAGYAILDADFSQIDDGVTVAFKTKISNEDAWAPLLSFQWDADSWAGDTDYTYDEKFNFWALRTELNPIGNVHGNGNAGTVWYGSDPVDPVAVSNTDYDDIALTISKDAMCVYKNGALYKTVTNLGGGTFETLLGYIKNNSPELHLGHYKAWWDWVDYQGSYKDVSIYKRALTATEIYYLVTGQEEKEDSLISAPTASINGSQVEVGYTTDITPDSVEVTVGGTKVNEQGGKFLYTPSKAGEYEFTITAKKSGYINDVEKVTIKVALEDEKLVLDEELIQGLKVSSDDTNLSISWTALQNAAVTAELVSKDGKKVSVAADGSAALSGLENKMTYTVTATAVKDGYATKTAEKTFIYRKGKPFEVLTGTEWWTGNEVGKDYAFSGNGTMVFDVDFIGPQAEANGAFSLELQDSVPLYVTTGSDINIWGEGCGNYAIDGASQAGKITPGHKYRITIERNNSNLSITYYDVTAKKQHCKLTGTNCVLASDFNVHVMGQVGSFQVHKCVDWLELSAETLSVQKGKTGTLELTDETFPADTTITEVTVSDDTVASAEISGGKVVVTGLKEDKTVVTVTGSNEKIAACAVNVYEKSVAVTEVTLNRQTATIEEGGTLNLVATVSPEDAIEKGVTWSSDNESVATVSSDGIVTAVAGGIATITAKSNENADISASCVVTVTESSAPDNTGGPVNDESKLGTYRSDLAYKRVGVHDPSIVKDPDTERYYLFGSHCAWAYSDDLENWTPFTNNITEGVDGSAHKIFEDEINWCKKANPNYNVTGNLWAPDVIWDDEYVNADGSKGAWLMYMSINGPDWNSTISLLTSDRLDGEWTYVGPVIQSGMSKGYGVTFDYEKVTGGTDIKRYIDNVSGRGNPTLEAHAIDPCVLYDDNGDFWMSYGSWSGGISMIKLDKKTGLRDYNTKYSDTNNAPGSDGLITDPYMGYKIAGGNAVSGEGSYIEKIGDYYFLFLSYGGYAPDGGYNMRVFRSKDIKGPYEDVADKDARYALNTKAGDTAGTTGMRIMSYYKWSFADYGYTAQGHNSAIADDDGKAYVIYHNKYNDGTAAHEVRVHQLLTNEDGWILAAPFEYAGETVKETGYSQKVFTGDYGIMLQKQNINHARLECQAEQRITLEEGTPYSNETGTGYTGNITGDYTGTWTSKAGSPYVSLKIGNTTYKGVFCEGTIDETDIETMTFTAVGNNQECLWGYKAKDPTVAIRMTIDKVIKIPDTVATDIPLPAMGAGGSTITWRSNNIAIADDGTIPHLFNEDVKASMTATITNNGYEYEHVYEFTVLGNDRLSKGDDVTIKEFYKENPLDLSGLKMGTTPKFANPFHYTHEDISGGVSISFDVTRTAASDRLSNIISFNNKLGKLYFTGGSYLGYNDFNGRFMDANLNSNFAPGEDYLSDNTKTNIKIEINQDGFTVYQNDKAVYSSSDVKSTKVPGGFSDNNPEKSILSWIKTAPELNFGSGNFWADLIFKGEISNVVCAYKQKAVDVEGGGSSLAGIYTQDYESVSDISKEWQSTNAQGNISLGREEGYGKYMSYDFTGETGTNSRGAHSYFGEGITWPSDFIMDFDIALKAGNNQESQFAVLTSNAAFNSNNENNGINTGYVFKMTSSNSETWTINGDTSKTAIIPKSEWVHFTLTGTKGQTAAHLTITNGNNKLFDGDVTATDTGDIKGMYILAGRYQAAFKVDNISVKEPSTGGADHTAYNKLMNRVQLYESVKSIYTNDSYKVLSDAVEAAKSEVTNAATQEVIDRHVEALKAAIRGLVRKVCIVTVTEADNGTVTGLAADGRYMAGDSMVLKAVPNEGYDLDCWKTGEEIASYSRKYSAKVMEDITLTPVFKTADEPTPPPSSSEEPVVTPSPLPSGSSSPLPGSTPTPKPSGSNPGGGIGGYVPSVSAVPVPTPVPGTTKAPEASQKPVASPTPEASKAPEASATPAPGTDIKVDEETGAVIETTTKVDGNKTTVIEKVTTPDGVENIKETVTEKFDGLTVKTETFTNSETASVLVTTVKSDADGKVVDANAVVYTGLSDRNSNYSSKTAIPESYMQNVKAAGINNIDIYVEKPTVDAVKNNLGRKMVIKISIPKVEGVSVKNVIVTKESIDSAKEGIRKLVVKIESNTPSDCYTITIPQSELKKMDSKINVAVKTGKVSSMDSSNSKKVNKILTSNKLDKDNSYVVTIASNDTKGGIKVTTPALLPSVKEGDKVYAYSYNKKTGKLEEIPNSKRTVIEGGEAAIEGFSGNTYVITDKELSGKNVVTLLDKAKVSVSKTSFKPGNKIKVKVNLGNGLVSKTSVNSTAPYAKQAAVVKYKSSSKKVKVSKDGTVTAKGKGKATITIKIKLAGGKVKTVKKNVTVK